MKIMKPSYFYIAILTAFLLSPAVAAAQTQETGLKEIFTIVPKPFIDLFNTFNKINLDFPQYELLRRTTTKYLPQSKEGLSDIFGGVSDIFNRVNGLMESKFGVGLANIIKAIGNVLIWLLELLARLIRLGLGYLSK
ncbi:MAG: hypothetical protein HY456_00230 [Parcubacteria group bacterium]|nr:hypothetical protein [Parcubacteria group bacterium]